MPAVLHVPVAPQSAQAAAPVPHARAESPPRHVVPSQQPCAHVVESQTGVTHAPLRHCWPFVQRVHIAPPEPQTKLPCIDGATQKPMPQQPLQVPGPHAATMH